VLAQLRGVLPAEQSAEMSEEHHHDGPVSPELAETARRARGIGQLHLGETICVHN